MKRRSKAGGQTVKARRRKSVTPKRLNATTPLPSRPAVSEDAKATRFERERDEALKQLSAASEVLGVIANSSGNLDLVFETILENATRICEAVFGNLWLREDDNFRIAATHGTPTEWREYALQIDDITKVPTSGSRIIRMDRGSVVGRAAIEGRPVHIPDVLADPEYTQHEGRKIGGWRAALGVPLLQQGNVVGVLFLSKAKPQAFSDKQIALVQSFAAQAVIAIENTRLLNELRESLERQTATADVLQVISSSPGELAPVFQAMLENATRICEAKFGMLFLFNGEELRVGAEVGVPLELAKFYHNRGAFLPDPATPLGRVLASKEVIHTPDQSLIANQSPSAKLGGARSHLAVPMLKEGNLVGAIAIYRTEVAPFTDKQIELVKNFAAQAVIAIENARLLNELRQRTTDLSESLEQQMAASEVLKVISSSPGELTPVFRTMLENAVRICEARFGDLFLHEGEGFRNVAQQGPQSKHRELWQQQPFLDLREAHPGLPLSRVAATKGIVQLADVSTDDGYKDRGPRFVALVESAGARTVLGVPMLKNDELIGAIIIYRTEVRPFTGKQIDLVKNFAAQAVIAIENARLLNELRESLDRQTATADILRVIAGTPEDSKRALDTIAETASRMFDTANVNFRRLEGDVLRIASSAGPHVSKLREVLPDISLEPTDPAVRSVLDNRQIAVEDRLAALPNERGELARTLHNLALRGLPIRSQVFTPLLREGKAIGVMIVSRGEVRPFQEHELDLMRGFADQAVIAIENARLLSELRDSYRMVQQQAGKLEAQSQELVKLNQQLEQRVADQVGEIERMGRLRRFLPPQVADLIVASGTEKQLESHRREITALFCDLRGFTGFSESSDPEDVMALLAEYHAAIGTIINKYSGTLERYAGDGVMVIFNDPVPVENPALQAVLMALDMRSAIGGLIEKWRDLGHDLGFGIGIAHGFATLGTIGFEGRRDYAAIGTVSNVASRLCDEAKPSQILISPRVRQAVDNVVTVEPVGEFTLKGIRRPMMTYNVLKHPPAKPN